MTAIDTNILLHGFSRERSRHFRARRFLEQASRDDGFALSEFVLVEFYTLLRNPAVLRRPLDAEDAARVVETYRRHPRWSLLGFNEDSVRLHEHLWKKAARPGFGRRRIYDARLALNLRAHGVTAFATANVKDFRDFGFRRVWNPLE